METRNEAASSFDADALTRALRIAGAVLVVASASTFMLQHWQAGNDLWRYAMLVGQSLLLAVAAYFVGLTLREGRSARTFLALVLATMPVSFAVLGGLVYSQFHLEALAPLPSYATWVAPSKLAALLAVSGTFLLLVPLAVVSFVALARKEAVWLTLAFFGANLLVLVPVRQPLTVVVLAGVALLALLRLELARFGRSAQLDTLEGKLARAMPFAPPLIMLGRVFHLYRVGPGFLGGVLLIGAAAIWLAIGRARSSGLRDFGAWGAAIFGIAGWVCCWVQLLEHVHTATPAALLLGLPCAAVTGLCAVRAEGSRRSLLFFATLIAMSTSFLACTLEWSTLAALSCIVLGIAVAVWGASTRALLATASGALLAVFGLGVQVWLAVHADNLLRWASLSGVGVLLIVGSAYVERNRGRITELWETARARRLEQQLEG